MSILYITRPMLLKQQSSSSLGRVTDCLEFFYLKPLFFPKEPVPMYIIKCARECASSFVNNPSSIYITPGGICHLFLSLGESHNNMPCNCIDAQRQSRESFSQDSYYILNFQVSEDFVTILLLYFLRI